MQSIVQTHTDISTSNIIHYMDNASKLYNNSHASNTLIAYQSDMKQFKQFCSKNDLDYTTASSETIAVYISYMQQQKEYKYATIQRRVQAIANFWRESKQDDVTKEYHIQKLLKGVKREIGVSQTRKQALESKDIYKFVFYTSDDLKGKRDKALLLIGYSGAFRRSELVALNIDDLEFNELGVIVHIRKSKTDQFKKGSKFALHYSDNTDMCPVLALQQYIEKAQITSGALFRTIDRHSNIKDRITTHGVAYILKQYAKELGYNEAEISGHSLRRGAITTAAKNGVSFNEIRTLGRYSDKSVMPLRYAAESKLYEFNRTKALGL